MSQLITPEGRSVYRMLDNPKILPSGKKENTPALAHIGSWSDAELWNTGKIERDRHYGIFWTVNQFDGERKIDKLEKLLSWSVDIDLGSKESQREKIKQFLTPSMVVETKRGYQCYWDAIDATKENYNKIQTGLVKFFGGDNNAKDIARIMRVPFFFHMKNPQDPFIVKVAHSSNEIYSEEKFLRFLPKDEPMKIETKAQTKKALSFINDSGLFERIYSMDCEQALRILSGHSAVCGETFEFKRTSGGNMNLIVDGKGTSVFIDKDKRIGSSDKGGPTVWQFVNWYHGDHSKTYRLMKEVFPEIFKDEKIK